ncbi:glycosyltransferase family 2 protein [Autumnicola musiva]|uniref:Glycosyltransferase family 2 protein n=1 Tax=Autumnicola musiva TaxID=3075589 RepID=A0ABU3D372_9FLAO|nr:glycosyltransferase family 2 protein [Zunongwangia sp. F117]MDT0675983.1 glycosyltransferase family 2 protein [Zunongwangia sp. F117]
MNQKPECSIITINYNNADLCFSAVKSILQHSQIYSYEIIVVDNGSELPDFKRLKELIFSLEAAEVKLIKSRINTGFGGGNMMGVQQAKGRFYVFANSDVILQKDTIAVSVNFLMQNKNTAMVGGIASNEHGKVFKTFLYGLGLRSEILSEGFLTFVSPKKYPSRRKTITTATKVDAVPGSFLVCKAEDFDYVGGFDTNLFLYYEEKDLAFRIRKFLNKDIYILPDAEYIHLKGKSTPSSYAIKKELKISQFYSVRKNLGLFKYLLFYSFNFLKFLLKAPFNKKNRKYLSLIINGVSLTQSLKHKQKLQPANGNR